MTQARLGSARSTRSTPPLRPLSTTELLDGAVRAVWVQRRAVYPLAAPFVLAMAALQSLLQYATLNHSNAALLTLGGTLLVPVLLRTPITALVAPAIGASLVGERLTAGACVRALGRRWFGLLVLAVVLTLTEGVGLVLLVVGGVWLWGVWALAAPALALERLGPFAALRRSFDLVRGDFWRVWGIRALGYVVTYVINQVASIPFQLIALGVTGADPLQQSGHVTDQPGLYVAIISVGTVIGLLVSTPIACAVDVFLYTDQRMRHEGMDILMGLPPVPADQPPAPIATAR